MLPGFFLYTYTFLNSFGKIIPIQFNSMKKITFVAILFTLILSSSARGITPYQAAKGKAKCGRYIK